jgi:hypothetical protein
MTAVLVTWLLTVLAEDFGWPLTPEAGGMVARGIAFGGITG